MIRYDFNNTRMLSPLGFGAATAAAVCITLAGAGGLPGNAIEAEAGVVLIPL